MTAPRKDSDQAAKKQDELELQKKTLKDLPESGEDVKGGRRVTTINVSTVVC